MGCWERPSPSRPPSIPLPGWPTWRSPTRSSRSWLSAPVRLGPPAVSGNEGREPMFKRLFWLLVGASFGFGASFWLARAVRQTIERYAPERLSSELAQAARGLGQDLRLAVADGRQAMRERELSLRRELDRRSRP